MAAKVISRPKTPTRNLLIGRSRERVSMDPVEVFCRVRPIGDQATESCVTALDDKTLQMTEPSNLRATGTNSDEPVKLMQAQFTHVFEQNSSQKEVFDRVALDLCDDLIQGKNGLLFTYGITGSGKTYTMTGCPTDIGILPRCLDVVFNSISSYQTGSYVFLPDKMNGFDVRSEAAAAVDRARLNLYPPANNVNRAGATPKPTRKLVDGEWEIGPRTKETDKCRSVDEDNAYSVFVSYVEIYNNYIYDLLDPPADKTKPPQSKGLREDFYRNMYVSGVTEVEVKDTDEAFDVLMRGQKLRRVAHTILNTESSRSHSVFNIRLVQAPLDENGTEVIQDKNKVHVSQLSLVDLAGSERSSRTGNVGDRMRETGRINTSLMCLRQCIEQLRENQKVGSDKMVPYRDSRLTHLFKNYFDGEGKVRMIVCINPSTNDYEENLHVLQFAELTQEVEVPRGEAVHYDDGLTPGRRRAAQIIQEVKEKLEQDIANISNSLVPAALPKAPTFSLFFDAMPIIDFNNCGDEEALLYNLKRHFELQRRRREERINEASAKQTAFEEALRKYIIEFEALKKRHEECGRYRDNVETENRRLKSEVMQLRQRLQTTENRLSKYERDTRYFQNQEEAIKRRELEMANKLRIKDDKLRAVKEIFDRPPATGTPTTNQNGSDEYLNRMGRSNVRPGAPLVSVVHTNLYPSLTPMKRRAPSPPPKPVRNKDKNTYNTRSHRRSQSSGNVPVDGLGASGAVVKANVSHYCPGRPVRRVHLVKTDSTSGSEHEAGNVKRKSDEELNENATKRNRGF